MNLQSVFKWEHGWKTVEISFVFVNLGPAFRQMEDRVFLEPVFSSIFLWINILASFLLSKIIFICVFLEFVFWSHCILSYTWTGGRFSNYCLYWVLTSGKILSLYYLWISQNWIFTVKSFLFIKIYLLIFCCFNFP